jgi:O-antigen/teichoic acid export membrane protein
MRRVVSFVIGVARFFYGFIFGDDWRVAAAVLLALLITGLLVANQIAAWWLVPAIAIAMTWVSLQRARPAQPSTNPGPRR